MNSHRTSPHSGRRWAAVGALALISAASHAAPFLYAPGDLILTVHKSGNASDYVVNVGKATNFSALPAGTTLPINNLSAAQLNSAFSSLDDIKWSVLGANRPPEVPAFPLQTLWVTAPREDSSLQSAPWLRKGQFVQGTAASQIDAIGVNAAASSSSQSAGPNNTATGVVIPVNSDFAITPLLGDAGDLTSTFQGSVENVTAIDFPDAPENVSRADLYEVQPGSAAEGTRDTPGRFLGYFELKPDGTLIFNTGTPPPPRPTITEVKRNGNVTTVSFTTVNSGTYLLRATGAAGLITPVSTWPTSASVSGNGTVVSLQDTNSSAIRFFAIEVQP